MRRFLRRVLAMARKEVAHVRRDAGMLYLAIGMPLLLICIFGFGVRFDADHLTLAVVDLDQSPASLDLVREAFASGEFLDGGRYAEVSDAESAIRSNLVVGALVIGHGYGDALARRTPARVQLLVDGTDGTIANVAMANAEALSLSLSLREERRRPSFSTAISTRYNPSGESAMFLLPGTIAYVLALVSVLLTSLAVAREWERGSMEQLFATSVSTFEIVIGKLLPYLGLGALNVLLAVALGATVFDLPLRGSLLLVATGSMLFILGMLGQGLLISIVTRNQMLATQAGALSAMLPSLLLSGFLFPTENLPFLLRLLSAVVPARFLIALLRGVLLKEAGWLDVWGELLGLGLFAVFTLTLSAAKFRRRIA